MAPMRPLPRDSTLLGAPLILHHDPLLSMPFEVLVVVDLRLRLDLDVRARNAKLNGLP